MNAQRQQELPQGLRQPFERQPGNERNDRMMTSQQAMYQQ